MITWTTGDLFASCAEVLVNPVNCVGVMGKGLALEFRTRFPRNYRYYRRDCALGLIRPGRIHIPAELLGDLPMVFNLPTKRHWRDRSRLADVEAGVQALGRLLAGMTYETAAVPPLGCGLGGLSWTDVRPIVERELTAVGTHVMVYEPPAGRRRGYGGRNRRAA